jgi:type VI secretion system protein ImpG
MDSTDKLYQDFLSELDTLERFRQGFKRTYTNAPLEREDPDVRRLMEAMAFFSVQTRQATLHNLRSTWLRLFSSYFAFLLEPLPAAALVQAVPSNSEMAETVRLPRGTELRLEPEHGVPGTFRLERDLTILPVALKQTDLVRRDDEGWRLILRFEGTHPRKDLVGRMSLHVRHLDDYRASLAVFHALRKHLEKVTVLYDERATNGAGGTRCDHAFRTPAVPEEEADLAHPLQRVRSFFQQPEQGLFLHVDVPPAGKAWTRFSLCLDLKKEWTVGRSPNPDFLQPFVVPVVNLKAEPAQPLVVDGTRSEYPLLSLSGGADLRLQSVTGVYEMTKTGRVPMRPAFLPGEGPSYEIDDALDASLTPHPRFQVRMPEAFLELEPRKVLVEAHWYQPRFAEQATGPIAVSTPSRHVKGLGWQVLGTVRPHHDSPLRDNIEALMQLLAWKVKPTLSREELLALLSHLGTPVQGPFRPLLPWIRMVRSSVLPDGALRGTGLRHVYEVLLEPFNAGMEPLVTCLLEQVRAVLDAWNGEATVEVRARTASGSFEWKDTTP